MHIPLPALRVLVGLAVCGACFQAGRWTELLARRADGPPAPEAVRAPRTPPPVIEEPLPGVMAGHPEGQGDIITPLNVRDPTALIMGPGASQRPPEPPTLQQPITPPAPPEPVVPLKPKKGVVPRGEKEHMEPTPEKY